jgi:hypothetical protein
MKFGMTMAECCQKKRRLKREEGMGRLRNRPRSPITDVILMKIPSYEIYALKYAGPFIRPAAMMTWFHDLDKTTPVNYYLFALLGGEEPSLY